MNYYSYKVKDGDDFYYVLLEDKATIRITEVILGNSREYRIQPPFSESTIQEKALDFDETIKPVVAAAKSLLAGMKKATADKITIDFGVDICHSKSSPLITKTVGEGAFKIQLTWESKPKKPIG